MQKQPLLSIRSVCSPFKKRFFSSQQGRVSGDIIVLGLTPAGSRTPKELMTEEKYPAHNLFVIDGVTFSSKFDNGNLLAVEKIGKKNYEYQIWSACDNHGTPQESKHCTWFYFTVSGLTRGCTIKIVSCCCCCYTTYPY